MPIAAAFTLAAHAAAFAATPATTVTTADNGGHRLVIIHNAGGSFTPPLALKAKLPAIFSNFATLYPKGVYNASNGAVVAGPNNFQGQSWLAAAFTPATTATVQEIDVAAGFINGAKNVVQIGLYSDASGIPGTKLWSGNAVLPTFGLCCAIIVKHDKGAVTVTAGTQYWVALTTLSSDPNFYGAWNLNVLDQVDTFVTATNFGNGWNALPTNPNFAFGVYGK
jgi:hypothetical protein